MNYDHIKIIEIKNNIVIFNHTNGITFEIHKDVYNLIKNCKSKDDILKIADTRSESDRKFFVDLANTIDENKVLKNCSTNKINEISYIVTDKCNLSCKHCCMSAKPYNKNKDEKIMINPSVMEKIVSYNPKTIIITGGEPLIVYNIIEILTWLRKNYKNEIILSTNAVLIDEKNAKFLSENVDIFDISLDGLTAEKSDNIRGKGTFDKVISAVKILKKAGSKRIRLSNALSQDTKDDTEEYNRMCAELEVEPIVRHMTPTGRAKDNNLFFNNPISQFQCTAHYTPNVCGAGITMLTIDSNGNVYPCNNFTEEKYKMGNLLDEDFSNTLKIYKDSMWFKNFSHYLPNYRSECKECEVSQYCWTCPFQIKLLEESMNISDLTTICKAKKEEMIKVF